MNGEAASLRIRPMTAADIERVVTMAAGLDHAPHWPVATYMSILTQGTGSKRIALVADEIEAGVVGFAIASVVASEGELESIAVAPAFQRKGVAKRLFDELRGELRGAEVTEVHLEVRASNHAALGLHGSLGFEVTGRRKGYYADPVDDAVLMRLGIERLSSFGSGPEP